MNNAILFFYDINIQEIKKINNDYYFKYLNNNYVIYSYIRDISEIDHIYNLNLELLQKGLIGYEIIPTKTNDIVFSYEDRYYLLMKMPNIKNRIITYEDVISFNFLINDNKYNKLDKSNWGLNWSSKIDFIIYQFSSMKNKYRIIDNSLDYFICIWENGISYYNDNVIKKHNKYVCHKRIRYDMDLLNFLNPLEFIIDYKERDVGDYFKSYVMNNNYTLDTLKKYLNGIDKDSIILIISRVLFPSYYFDLYEDIVLDNEEENQLNEIIENRGNIINLLKYIFDLYSNYNIPYIEWIKK